tara:strand:- start:38554 stop:39081 length:528 start_codon:yes stop_codon:yes gene_type:complete
MITTVILQAAIPGPVYEIYDPNPPPKISGRSEAILDINCDIAERKGAWQKIAFRRTGGRAYQIEGEEEIRNAPVEWAVLSEDPRFSKPSFKIDQKFEILFSFPGRKWLWVYPSYNQSRPYYGNVAIKYEDDVDQKNFRFFVGICDVRRTPQSPISYEPLSKAEAEQYRDKRFQKQ